MSAVIRDHKDLIVWQRACDLVKLTYELCSSLPDSEKYGLRSQLQRAAVSIPTNIAEGRLRGTRKDFAQFLAISAGSAAELETLIILAHKLDFLSVTQRDKILNELNEIRRMLHAMRKKLKAANT
jgi:four helix bundle protein